MRPKERRPPRCVRAWRRDGPQAGEEVVVQEVFLGDVVGEPPRRPILEAHRVQLELHAALWFSYFFRTPL